MSKLWMSGVGTLCAIAHYRASLFNYIVVLAILTIGLTKVGIGYNGIA